jgi:serine/threonine-protein kinase
MSPEQARSIKEVDHRTDLWALGVIAFECVVGHVPFPSSSMADLLIAICVAPLPKASELVPSLPKSLDAWLSQALERDPNRRFSSARQMAEGLASVASLTSLEVSGSLHLSASGSRMAIALDPTLAGPSSEASGSVIPASKNASSKQFSRHGSSQAEEPSDALSRSLVETKGSRKVSRGKLALFVGCAAIGLAAAVSFVTARLATRPVVPATLAAETVATGTVGSVPSPEASAMPTVQGTPPRAASAEGFPAQPSDSSDSLESTDSHAPSAPRAKPPEPHRARTNDLAGTSAKGNSAPMRTVPTVLTVLTVPTASKASKGTHAPPSGASTGRPSPRSVDEAGF